MTAGQPTSEQPMPGLDLWEAARLSARGLRLRFRDEQAAFRAQMRLYSYRAKDRKRNGGSSLYDLYSVKVVQELLTSPSRPWTLYIYPAGTEPPFQLDAEIEQL